MFCRTDVSKRGSGAVIYASIAVLPPISTASFSRLSRRILTLWLWTRARLTSVVVAFGRDKHANGEITIDCGVGKERERVAGGARKAECGYYCLLQCRNLIDSRAERRRRTRRRRQLRSPKNQETKKQKNGGNSARMMPWSSKSTSISWVRL